MRSTRWRSIRSSFISCAVSRHDDGGPVCGRPGGVSTFSRGTSYVDFFIGLLERLRPDLVVERFASEAPPRFQAGPTWGFVRNEQLWSLLERRLEQRGTWQGRLYV